MKSDGLEAGTPRKALLDAHDAQVARACFGHGISRKTWGKKGAPVAAPLYTTTSSRTPTYTLHDNYSYLMSRVLVTIATTVINTSILDHYNISYTNTK